MGYSTDFFGSFEVSPPLSREHHDYLSSFCEMRHVKYRKSEIKKLFDPAREAVGISDVGPNGVYFVGDMRDGDDPYKLIVDNNTPPDGVPGLWCDWYFPTTSTIEWNNSEKFYNYVEWIQYLINHFLGPWGYMLNGDVRWEGETREDIGVISIRNNVVTISKAKIVFEKSEAK